MSDISRTNQPFLATSTVWQPQTHSCNAICRDWWTDSLHSKTYLETAFVYLLFHSFQKLLERVGWRRRRGAYRLTNRLQTFANTVKDIFEPDGFVVIDFLVRHRRLPSILFSVIHERVSVVNAVVGVQEMDIRNGRLRWIAINVNATLALRFSLNETFVTLYKNGREISRASTINCFFFFSVAKQTQNGRQTIARLPFGVLAEKNRNV